MKRKSNILLLLLVFILSGCYAEEKSKNFQGTGQTNAGSDDRFSWDANLRPTSVATTQPVPAPTQAKVGPPKRFSWDSNLRPKPAAPTQPEPVFTPAPVQPARFPAPTDRSIAVKPGLVAINGTGLHVVSMTHPSAGYGVLQLDKTIPKEIGLNKPFNYTLKVTNLTDATLTDLVITEDLPANFRFTGANPAVEQDVNKLLWRINSLQPRASNQLTISGVATNTDYLEQCTTVVHLTRACSEVRVVQPRLELAMTAPHEVLLCEPIPVEFVVSNTGTGTEQNVNITSTLPTGLRTIDGKNKLVFEAGTLLAGQSQQFSAQLKAARAGTYTNSAVALSASGLKAETTAIATAVRKPVLTILNTCPDRQFLGRPVTYEITVTNTGDGPAKDTVLEDVLPPGVISIEATAGAKFAGSRLSWELGTLAPKTSKKVRVSCTPTKVGPLTSFAIASAYCVEPVTTSTTTSVIGIPAVRLEVIDTEDPVEVGNQTTYVITLTNQGSAPDTNIRVVCTLENNLQYISSTGATTGSIMGNTLSFVPLGSLAPKANATWRVTARGIKPGEVRFRVIINTDQLVRPVEETEATYLYQ